MTKPTANLRMFVAIYPPPELAASLLQSLRRFPLPEIRKTPHDQVHLTLQFIGDVPSERVPDVIESVRRAAAGLHSFDLSIRGYAALPDQPFVRLMAATTDATPTLLELRRRLVVRLASTTRGSPNDRFRPHITLGHFPLPTSRMFLPVGLESEPVCGGFRVERLCVMRSTLRPEGALHHLVAEVALNAGCGPPPTA